MNKILGRRGTIFVTCAIAALTCLWQGFTNSWQHLFVARFVLGFGIGPKSSTVPVYAAECAPAPIRGALVMMWQMWTAFGIMLGYVTDVAFYKVHSDSISGLNWRLMLASAMVLPLVVCAQVYLCPESPRWYMGKGRYGDAYQSMMRLRHHRIQAARDIFYMHTLLEAEKEMKSGRNRVVEMFTIPRNRRAAQGSWIVMVHCPCISLMSSSCNNSVESMSLHITLLLFFNVEVSHRSQHYLPVWVSGSLISCLQFRPSILSTLSVDGIYC